jgi:hypothetical protein
VAAKNEPRYFRIFVKSGKNVAQRTHAVSRLALASFCPVPYFLIGRLGIA